MLVGYSVTGLRYGAATTKCLLSWNCAGAGVGPRPPLYAYRVRVRVRVRVKVGVRVGVRVRVIYSPTCIAISDVRGHHDGNVPLLPL